MLVDVNPVLRRLFDPLVVIAALTTIVTVIGSYFALSNRISQTERDTITIIARLERENDNARAADAREQTLSQQTLLITQTLTEIAKWEDERHLEHDAEWLRQNEVNTKLQTFSDDTRQSLAVLRAELDGILVNHEHGQPEK
jgi:hypothetical protein